jgi:hypothetical protein
MRIPLGHLQTGVAQDLLQVIDVSTVHHEVRCEGVPKIVKAELLLNLGQLQKPSQIPV